VFEQNEEQPAKRRMGKRFFGKEPSHKRYRWKKKEKLGTVYKVVRGKWQLGFVKRR